MIVLAFFGGFLALMLVAAMFYDRLARRRGLRPGVPEREVLKREGTSDYPSQRRRYTGGPWAVTGRGLSPVTLPEPVVLGDAPSGGAASSLSPWHEPQQG